MAPEILLICNNLVSEIEFNPEKSDIFSLGLTFLRYILILEENDINGLNEDNSFKKI